MDLEICFEIRRIDFHHSQWSCQGMWHMTLGLFKRLSHEAIRDELKSKLKWINKQNTIDWSDTIIDTVQERLWLRDTESVSRAPIKHVAVAAICINDLLTNSSSLSLCVLLCGWCIHLWCDCENKYIETRRAMSIQRDESTEGHCVSWRHNRWTNENAIA